jgi:hypothetical protein
LLIGDQGCKESVKSIKKKATPDPARSARQGAVNPVNGGAIGAWAVGPVGVDGAASVVEVECKKNYFQGDNVVWGMIGQPQDIDNLLCGFIWPYI